jgi:hypothetical protein
LVPDASDCLGERLRLAARRPDDRLREAGDLVVCAKYKKPLLADGEEELTADASRFETSKLIDFSGFPAESTLHLTAH